MVSKTVGYRPAEVCQFESPRLVVESDQCVSVCERARCAALRCTEWMVGLGIRTSACESVTDTLQHTVRKTKRGFSAGGGGGGGGGDGGGGSGGSGGGDG
jgi:uncharacterized membrane protein YgcG